VIPIAQTIPIFPSVCPSGILSQQPNLTIFFNCLLPNSLQVLNTDGIGAVSSDIERPLKVISAARISANVTNNIPHILLTGLNPNTLISTTSTVVLDLNNC